MDALLRELKRAVGLGGRDRPTGSDAERARINVVRSLRRAIAAIAVQAPLLGAHLDDVRPHRRHVHLPAGAVRRAVVAGGHHRRAPRLSRPSDRNGTIRSTRVNASWVWGPHTDRSSVSVPCGVSHVAVVTGDLDGYRAFYEEVIGLETTLVLGAGRGHGRQAVLSAGEVMLHVFEVPGYDPTINGFSPAMFERGRLDHLGFTVADVGELAHAA